MTPEPTKCRGCGRAVFFVRDSAGKTQILDRSAPTYTLTQGEDGEPLAERAIAVYVSHFSTCTKANDFSKGRR